MRRGLGFKIWSRSTALFFLVICLSCENNSAEEKLIGNWYTIDETEKIEIGKDSLFTQPLFKRVSWSATKDSLSFKVRNNYKDSLYTVSLRYEFSNDTLIVYPFNRPNDPPSKFLRSKDLLDFIFSNNDVNISLPEDTTAEVLSIENKHGFKIFAEKKEDKLYFKSEYSNSLENLEKDLETHIAKFGEEIQKFKEDFAGIQSFEGQDLFEVWIKFHVHFPIYADASIDDSSLQPLYDRLKALNKTKKIYRIYGVDESMNVDFYKLKGISKY